ncbi:MAG: methyltransferase domain-containing protein [Thermoanaerobaculia bacterium]|nr:methyltransferase domain-containing protein [Thermoanaerobaculia bacterium]
MSGEAPGDPRRRLTEFWDRSRGYYELAIETNPSAAPERAVLFRHLEGGERVLDLGCGSCENALWLPVGCSYLGMDISTTALAMAAEMGRPGVRLRGDAQSLPLATGSLDAVLSTWAIEHFHDPGRTLAEVARVLKPGGRLLLVGSAWDLPHALAPSLHPDRRLKVTLARLGRQVRSLADGRHRFDMVLEPRALTEEFVPDSDAVHLTQSYQVRRYLEACGLRILEQRSLPHGNRPSLAQRLLRGVLRVVPLWRHGWGNTLIVAQRTDAWRRPPYELLEL